MSSRLDRKWRPRIARLITQRGEDSLAAAPRFPGVCLHPEPPDSSGAALAHTGAAIAPGRRNKQTAPELSACRSSAPLPIIGAQALLKLADWSRLHMDRSQHGRSSCDTTRLDQSPPAPAEGRVTNSSQSNLASHPSIRSRSDTPNALPCDRSATAKTSRQRGGRRL
jgi:hypothetical protein